VTVSRTDAEFIATDCLHAWTAGDFATARSLLQEDVSFVGPLGSADGIDAYMSALQDLAKFVRGADQKKVIVEGDDVCVIYDLVVVSAPPVPTAVWYHLRDGKIDSVRAFFDARSFPSTANGLVSDTPTESL
jgi:hypothetical protein